MLVDISNKACAILQATNDGDKLSGMHLKLVEMAINGQLNAKGIEAFEALHAECTGPTGYTHPWFHDIEHMIKDQEGYVRWKGVSVDHYSFDDRNEEKAAAEALAERCRALESSGETVSGRNLARLERESRVLLGFERA